ncbi:alpha-amylase family glycosyl hydrolase [Coraliomargarita sp. SDUM461004]|uniref:Alpha-amylase family glycosyl hydrolase n=1 Tax=Thalassobacterium sedimentorum TaxID=3041258 RepID=A0ABU1ADT5_9BACT|nr:alpha-amylase family glycosyl hydrolase [Coraliomargarita sp. SDUM461004]MDQ8192879.1 alpha-amylase family glycosyl hydrolase [Coraliomargarita sp. SDUM461004]
MLQPSWLKDAVIYQIYPQSFQDSNGDGIGDLPGVIQRLDYLQSLGINTIWLNPCFDSPFGDAGYDVRDFYRIASRYGEESDFVDLVSAAHARGIRVILDLVAGHTSMDHAWFITEANDPHSEDANRYIWINRDFDPKHGPVQGDFVSNFFWYQPALNFGYAEPQESWQDPIDAPGPKKNRAELRKILAYWFELGCDGFRVDMAGSLVKPEGTPASIQATKAIWQEIRAWMDQAYPDRVLMSEWSCPSRAIDAGFHLDFMLHFNAPGYSSLFFNGNGTLPPPEGQTHCYFDAAGEGNYQVFQLSYEEQRAATRGRGLITLPVGCHDFQRLRCEPRGWEELRCAWVFFMTQAGPPTIYYGEEIGMRYVDGTVAKEGSTLDGIIAVNAGTIGMGERSGTRTPMQWDTSPNAGFSSASACELYLPLDPDPQRPTVADQEQDPDSLLHFVRSLIRLRQSRSALGTDASIRFVRLKPGQEYPMIYVREFEAQRCLIVLNPSQCVQVCELPLDLTGGNFLLNQGCERQGSLQSLRINPFGYAIIDIE